MTSASSNRTTPLSMKATCSNGLKFEKTNFTGYLQNQGNLRKKTRKDENVPQINVARFYDPHRLTSAFIISNKKLQNYKFIETLGHGSFGIVKLAERVSDNYQVAIKTYPKTKLTDGRRLGNVRREIQLLKEMNHDNIIKLIEVIDTIRELHLVLEFGGSLSLKQWIKSNPNRSINDCKFIFKQIVVAVKYMHNIGIAHRDLKLDNILVNKLHVKIIDFGFSLKSKRKKLQLGCGTPEYMGPEIVQGRDYIAEEADIWALGIILYTLIAGKFPFSAKEEKVLYRKISACKFQIPSNISPNALNLINLILKIKPEERLTINQVHEHEWLRDYF